jgi:hypothetical protein
MTETSATIIEAEVENKLVVSYYLVETKSPKRDEKYEMSHHVLKIIKNST